MSGINGTAFADSLVGTAGDDSINGLAGNDSLDGAQGNDNLFGGANDDYLFGGVGNDTLEGGTGIDYLDGGADFDEASFFSSPNAVFASLLTGISSDGDGNEVLVNIEALSGSSFDDTLTGGNGGTNLVGRGGDDSLTGGLGDDQLEGGSGNDTLVGGSGVDRAYYFNAPSGVIVNLASGSASGGDGNDSLMGVENVTASSFDDTLTGNSSNNFFDGRGGTDTVVFSGSSAQYSVAFDGSSYTVTDNVASRDGVDNVTDVEFLQFIDGLKSPASLVSNVIIGTAGNDDLVGTIGNDNIFALASDDNLTGAKGNDLLDGGAGFDTAIFSGSRSNYLVTNTGVGSYTVVDNVGTDGTDTLVSIENLRFAPPPDVVIVGALDGRPVVGTPDTFDIVNYAGASAPVTANLITGSVTSSAGSNTLVSIEGVTGSGFDDVLIGNAAANLLDGGAGADTMAGGLGGDTYVVDNVNDVVVEDPNPVPGLVQPFDLGAIVDTIVASVNRTLENNVENLQLALGRGNLAGTGNAADNVLTGNEFDNVLLGLAGNDTLSGARGNDAMDGGEGDDTAVFSGPSTDYGAFFDVATSRYRISDSVGGRDGIDDLANIEFLQFSDGTQSTAIFGAPISYALVANAPSVNEGSSVIYTLTTAKVPAGTLLNYSLSGISSADIVGGSLTGQLSVRASGVTTFTIELLADRLTEGPETMVAKVGTAVAPALAVAPDVVINDTSQQDISPPTLTAVSPADQSAGVALDANIVVTFNEPVTRGTGNIVLKTVAGTVIATYDVAGTGNLAIFGNTLTINPSADFDFDTSYTLEFANSSIRDLSGNAFAGASNYKFTTLAAPGKVYVGSIGNDTLTGAGGNDTLTGSGGNDSIDGGAGIDTSVYFGPRLRYSVSNVASAKQVNDTGGSDGRDTLSNVERLKFSDQSVALDIPGNAGNTAKIIGAVFGREFVKVKEYVGIGIGLLDAGMSYPDLAQLAINFALGPNASNAAVVTLLYTKVVGVAPGSADLATFTGLLSSGAHTQATLGVLAADTDINQLNIGLVGLASTGLDFL